MNRTILPFLCILAMLPVWSGCTTGPLIVHETHYFKVGHGERVNFYRLTVDADTRLGISEYRSGWFPRRSVDSLLGDVTADGGASALRFRYDLEGLIETNVLLTTRNYLEEASKESADPAKLRRLGEARRRVLAYPQGSGLKAADFREIDFDPARGVVTQHGDEKLVFIVSSDPDQVVGKITAFSQSADSALTIQNLAQVMQTQMAGDLNAREGAAQARAAWDSLLVTQMTNTINAITNYNTAKSESLLKVNSLLTVLHARP